MQRCLLYVYEERKENKDIELNNENSMSCDFCNEEFKGSCALKSHITRDHPQTNAMIIDYGQMMAIFGPFMAN